MDQGFEHAPGWSFAPNPARSCRSRRRMTIGFSLEPKPPFRLDLTAWALRRRPSNAVDRWDGLTLWGVLMLNGKPCEVAVTQIAASNSPRLRVAITGARLTSDVKTVTTSFLERLLGIRIDLTGLQSDSPHAMRTWTCSPSDSCGNRAASFSHAVRSFGQWNRLPADVALTRHPPPQSARGTIGPCRAVDIRQRSCLPAPRRVGEHGAIRISQAGVQPPKRTLPDRAIAHFFRWAIELGNVVESWQRSGGRTIARTAGRWTLDR